MCKLALTRTSSSHRLRAGVEPKDLVCPPIKSSRTNWHDKMTHVSCHWHWYQDAIVASNTQVRWVSRNNCKTQCDIAGGVFATSFGITRCKDTYTWRTLINCQCGVYNLVLGAKILTRGERCLIQISPYLAFAFLFTQAYLTHWSHHANKSANNVLYLDRFTCDRSTIQDYKFKHDRGGIRCIKGYALSQLNIASSSLLLLLARLLALMTRRIQRQHQHHQHSYMPWMAGE